MKTYGPDWTAAEQAWSDYLDTVVAALRAIAAKPSDAYYTLSKQEYRCYRHAGKLADDASSWEMDGQEFCGTCGRVLDHVWTDHGIEAEMEYVRLEPLKAAVSAIEAHTLQSIIDGGVPRLTERCGTYVYRADLKPVIARVARRLGLPKFTEKAG